MTPIAIQDNDCTRSGHACLWSQKGRMGNYLGMSGKLPEEGPPGLGLEGNGEQGWKPTPELSCLESWDCMVGVGGWGGQSVHRDHPAVVSEISLLNQVGQRLLVGKAGRTSELGACANAPVFRTPVFMRPMFAHPCSFGTVFSSRPPPPSTLPSLALCDFVLIAAIKPPHLVRVEILIFIRPREGLDVSLLFSPTPPPLPIPL